MKLENISKILFQILCRDFLNFKAIFKSKLTDMKLENISKILFQILRRDFLNFKAIFKSTKYPDDSFSRFF